MKIHWPKTVTTVFLPALLLHLALVTGYIEKTSGAEGFFGHLVVLSWMIFLYPLVILGASLIVAFLVKEDRVRHFFIAFVLSLVINGTMLACIGFYYQVRNSEVKSEMYIETPMARPILDAKRPLSIVQPLLPSDSVASPIKIIVYAMPGVLESGESVVEIRSHNFDSSETVLWGSETLTTKKELAPDGERLIYTATVEFNPPENWERGQIIVQGANDSDSIVEIGEIRP